MLYSLTVLLPLCLLLVQADDNVDEYLDRCVTSMNHKRKPGPEGSLLEAYHCQPWKDKSCCTWNTTAQIADDGVFSLYGMLWDQCPEQKNMSDKCKQHFLKDTCFYECSPNLAPWIVSDEGKITRKERVVGVPLCHTECISWYHDCLFDYTCNDNWGTGWNWKKKGTVDMCTKPCKTFKEYFPDPKIFCEKIFNYSFKYETDAQNCMKFTPDGNKNREVAEKAAKAKLDSGSAGVSLHAYNTSMLVVMSVLLYLQL